MGFIQKKPDDEDLGDVLGTAQKDVDERESEARGDRGLVMDLDLLVCEHCRRELLPWQTECPDDGGTGVRSEQLPARRDDVLSRFLEREEAGDLPDAGRVD